MKLPRRRVRGLSVTQYGRGIETDGSEVDAETMNDD